MRSALCVSPLTPVQAHKDALKSGFALSLWLYTMNRWTLKCKWLFFGVF